jgi:hypothetical protein
VDEGRRGAHNKIDFSPSKQKKYGRDEIDEEII